MSYVQDRKKGLTKSKMNGYDLLSVFLENQDTFPDEAIVFNLIGFIFAATETTHFTSQTLISHLAQSKESLGKMRQDFVKNVYEPVIQQDPAATKLSRCDFLRQKLTFDVAQDAEYTTYCMKEALRYRPSVTMSQV